MEEAVAVAVVVTMAKSMAMAMATRMILYSTAPAINESLKKPGTSTAACVGRFYD
jgi:hypothetical protein